MWHVINDRDHRWRLSVTSLIDWRQAVMSKGLRLYLILFLVLSCYEQVISFAVLAHFEHIAHFQALSESMADSVWFDLRLQFLHVLDMHDFVYD